MEAFVVLIESSLAGGHCSVSAVFDCSFSLRLLSSALPVSTEGFLILSEGEGSMRKVNLFSVSCSGFACFDDDDDDATDEVPVLLLSACSCFGFAVRPVEVRDLLPIEDDVTDAESLSFLGEIGLVGSFLFVPLPPFADESRDACA